MRIFDQLGVFVYRFRWLVVLVWVVVLAVSAVFAPDLSERLKGGGFEGAGTEAEQVQDIMGEEFGVSPAALTVVFEDKNGELSARSEEFQKAESEALEDIEGLEQVRGVTTYAESGDARFISDDGKKSYAVIGFETSLDQTRNVVDLTRGEVRSEELTTYVTGAPAVYQDIEDASNKDVKKAEKYAFPFALIILVVAFGTLVAASIPVIIGGASVLAALAAIYFVSGIYDMSVFVLTISTMLGLGLGIDYALFAVSRFREELESYPVSEAVPRTVATAGRSIFFSGTAVLIGLSGLLFFPYMFMRSIGVAGVIVVFTSVVAALTLLPAVLGILGAKVNALSIRRGRGAPGLGFWSRSAEIVMRHPFIVLVFTGALLFALLYPVSHMKVGVPEASVLPKSYESRAGDDILKQDFDYASLNPIQVVATLPSEPLSADGLEKIRDLDQRLENTRGVSSVESLYEVGAKGAKAYAGRVAQAQEQAQAEAERRTDQAVAQQLEELRLQYGFVPPGSEERIRSEVEGRIQQEAQSRVPELPEGISADGEVTPEGVANFLKTPQARDSEEIQAAIGSYVAGDRTLLEATTQANPYTEEARVAVENARAVDSPEGVSFLVGGLSAGQKDFISSLYGDAPYAAAFVLGVTYLVLFLTFRSFIIPLKAVIVNILSLTASFGAMVLVFQDGHLSGFLNFTPLGFVDATVPVLMFCTVFGVSMDYEVFLLSRIREAYENGDSNTASVSKGLVSTAGIITSAAAIIMVVTGAFAFTGITTTKAVGLGLAGAVFVDATIIRILLVPATMRILGDWNWWPGGRKSVFSGKRKRGRKNVPGQDQ